MSQFLLVMCSTLAFQSRPEIAFFWKYTTFYYDTSCSVRLDVVTAGKSNREINFISGRLTAGNSAIVNGETFDFFPYNQKVETWPPQTDFVYYSRSRWYEFANFLSASGEHYIEFYDFPYTGASIGFSTGLGWGVCEPCPEGEPGGGGGTIPGYGIMGSTRKGKAVLECDLTTCPIVLDLEHNNFRFGGSENPVAFDMLGDGQPILMQWVQPGEDDVFLAVDINENGIVDDGSELFGNGTRLLLEGNRLAPNGFVGLAQYDKPDLGGNDDGTITEQDGIWSNLQLWLDSDADGVSTISEVFPLAETGVTTIHVIPRMSQRTDPHGNVLRFRSKAFIEGQGPPINVIDVIFLPLELQQ